MDTRGRGPVPIEPPMQELPSTHAMQTGAEVTLLITVAYLLYFIYPGVQLNAFTNVGYNASLAVLDLFVAIAYLPLTLIVSPLSAYFYFKSRYHTSDGSGRYFYGCLAVAIPFAILSFLFILFLAWAAAVVSEA